MDKRTAFVQLTTTPGAATTWSSKTGYPPTFGCSPSRPRIAVRRSANFGSRRSEQVYSASLATFDHVEDFFDLRLRCGLWSHIVIRQELLHSGDEHGVTELLERRLI